MVVERVVVVVVVVVVAAEEVVLALRRLARALTVRPFPHGGCWCGHESGQRRRNDAEPNRPNILYCSMRGRVVLTVIVCYCIRKELLALDWRC